MKAKFDSDDAIRDKLRNTKGALYEATLDREFGCGLTLSQRDRIQAGTITGKNLLGQILVEYRNSLVS